MNLVHGINILGVGVNEFKVYEIVTLLFSTGNAQMQRGSSILKNFGDVLMPVCGGATLANKVIAEISGSK